MTIVGTPPIKGEIKKARASGYNFTKAMGDIMDGAITMGGGSVVYVTINPSTRDPNKISSITVSDDIETGMASLKYTGTKHPLCWACDSTDHAEDGAISEFGTGLKAAAVNIGSKMTITTKYSDDDGKIHLQNIDCNWEKMAIDDTYEPTNIRDISEDEYNRLHKKPDGTPLNIGTTIELSEISDKFTGRTMNSVDELITYIANTYHSVGREIYVGRVQVTANVPCTHISDWAHDIHTIDVEIYDDDIIIKPMISTGDITDSSNKKIRKVEYHNTKHKFNTSAIKDGDYSDICRNQRKIDTCIFKATRQYGMGDKIQHKIKKWTLSHTSQGGSVNISRNGRMLTNWSKDNPRHISFGPKFHMEQHYNYFHMDYNSKQTGSLLGISYTKSIDGNFPKNKLFTALAYSHDELRRRLGGSTKYYTDWEKDNEIAWIKEFSPFINRDMAIHSKQWLKLTKIVCARYKIKDVIRPNIDNGIVSEELSALEDNTIIHHEKPAIVEETVIDPIVTTGVDTINNSIIHPEKPAIVEETVIDPIVTTDRDTINNNIIPPEKPAIAEETVIDPIVTTGVDTINNSIIPPEKPAIVEETVIDPIVTTDRDTKAATIIRPEKPAMVSVTTIIPEDNAVHPTDPSIAEETVIDIGIISVVQHNDITTTSMCVYGPQNYLGIFGCDETGINCTTDGICKGKFGFTTQMAKKRNGGGDYPSERFQMISVDYVTINCEPQLLQQIGMIEGVIFTTKERFTFPIEKLAAIKKVYNSVVSDYYRTPTLLVD
jgi:hypothetical protein